MLGKTMDSCTADRQKNPAGEERLDQAAERPYSGAHAVHCAAWPFSSAPGASAVETRLDAVKPCSTVLRMNGIHSPVLLEDVVHRAPPSVR